MRPSEEYTIHILEDKEFDLLPVGRPRDSLGMADSKRKIAWVRRTHVKDLDMANIHHEFDELMAKTSDHEIDGIRYKSGGGLGRILGPIIGTIVGVVTGNPVIGAAVGASISGGTQAHSQSVKPEKYGSGFGGIAKAGATGGAGAFGGSSLVNAARVAATNAAIAGGSTGAQIGAGIKGAVGAIPSAGGPALAGAKGALEKDPSGDLPGFSGGYTPQYMGQQFTPSKGTTAFSPEEVSSDVRSPLSAFDFKQGLANIDKNRLSRRSSVFSRFRGLGDPTSNTAFSKALQNVESGYTTTRQQFIDDQEERKRIAGIA